MDPNENNRNCPSSGSDADGLVFSATALTSAPLLSTKTKKNTQQQQHRPTSSSTVVKDIRVPSSVKSLNKGNNNSRQQQQRKRNAPSLPSPSHAVISVGGDNSSKKKRHGAMTARRHLPSASSSLLTPPTPNSNDHINLSAQSLLALSSNLIAPTVSSSNNNNANVLPSPSPAPQHPLPSSSLPNCLLPGNIDLFCKSCDGEDLNSNNTNSCESGIPSNKDDVPHDIDWCNKELDKICCDLNKDIIDYIKEVILPQKPEGRNIKWLVSIMIGLCPTPEAKGHESLGMRGRRNGRNKKTALSILLARLFGEKCLPRRDQGGIDSMNEDIATIFWANARERCTNNGEDCLVCRSWRMNEARAIGKALCILSKCVKYYGGNIVAINVAGVSVNAHYIFDILSKDGKFDGLSPVGTHISKLGCRCKAWTKKYQCIVAKSTLTEYDNAFRSSFAEIGFTPELSFVQAGTQSKLCRFVTEDGEVGSIIPCCSMCLTKAATHVDMHRMEEMKVNESSFNEGQDDEEDIDGDVADDNDNDGINIERCMYCEECCDPEEDGIMPLVEFRCEERRRKRREYYQANREKRRKYQSEYRLARFGNGGENDTAKQQANREEQRKNKREWYQANRENRCKYQSEYNLARFGNGGENDTAKQQANREEERKNKREWYQAKEGLEVCTLLNGRNVYFKPSTKSITAEQQVNREDQPYYEQDWFAKHFGNKLVSALKVYNSDEVKGNLTSYYINKWQLRELYEKIRKVEVIQKADLGSRQSLLKSLGNCSKKKDLNLYFNNEVILTIPPGTKLGLKIREELGGVVIKEVLETCTFKDIVGIGWRITSIDDVSVKSKDDFKAKNPNKHRMMRFVKPPSSS
jgi:hypothetical protein